VDVTALSALGDAAFSPATPVMPVLPPDVEAWVQAAVERFAENSALTEPLIDEDARIVIDWAEGEVWRMTLDAQPQDAGAASEILSPQLRNLRRYIRRTARLCATADDPTALLQTLLVTPVPVFEDEEG